MLIILQWDPMITTLPGLYLVTVGVIKPVVWLSGLTGNVVCSTAMLRFINLLFNCGNFYLLYLLICKLHHREKVLSDYESILHIYFQRLISLLFFLSFRHTQHHAESCQLCPCPPFPYSTSSAFSTTQTLDLLSSSSSLTS